MTDLSSFKELEARISDILHLGYATSILAWDMRTYMPKQGIMQRGTALSILQKLIHDKFTNPKMGELLKASKSIPNLTPAQIRELELFERDYLRETKVPTDLVGEISKKSSTMERIWVTAKQKSDFSMIKKDLQEMVNLLKKRAEFIDPSRAAWDVLADEYEPNVSADQITAFFNPVRDGTIKLIKKYRVAIEDCHDVPNPSLLDAPATKAQLMQVNDLILDFLQLDRNRIRVDETEHPFTSGMLDDVRITTHYLTGQPMASFTSLMHEAGHGMYDMNLPRDAKFTLRGQHMSMGIHESQSRFVENIIGKNPVFLKYIFPKLQKIIPPFAAFNTTEFIRALNSIQPTKIRIYADEVTYSLHIILRFEMERDLFSGKITVDELPQVWNEKMEKYLQQEIQSDAEGVLQDTHWYAGLFGYFPDYALGNLYNSQMLHIMEHQIPDWEEQLSQGKFGAIKQWLIKNVHQVGNMYDPLPFIEKLSGEPLNPHYFLDYAEMKFGKIFEF
ncbi:MAG: carboxypeptidase M32 [Candidatus Lokiarchaeota archaeon]|nr:carboxypeptidase M32 [Candidatus Harpocratesius repetitus]